MDDTIAAIATPLGVGGVGIVRISGEEALQIFQHLFSSTNGTQVESHRMLHGWVLDPKTREKTDKILACYMQSPKSFTGEDVVEFYCHGGVAVIEKILGNVLGAGARLAEKGEFSKRAFLNGKIDLVQAEAILDMVKAETVEGAGYAVRQLEGKLSKIVFEMRERILRLVAELEAAIDFSDDVPEPDREELGKRIGDLIIEIDKLLSTYDVGRVYRNGIATVILGKPNVGKSSLLNALLGEERAIVTEIPGTTRDAIEEVVNVQGIPLRIVDTAGIRHPRDKAEEFGVARTEKELEASELALVVIDGSQKLDELDAMVLEKVRGRKAVVVINKSDLGCNIDESRVGGWSFKTSARFGAGIPELIDGLHSYIQEDFGAQGNNSVAINARHKQCLLRAKEGLSRASESNSNGLSADFLTIDLKESVLALGEITGEIVSEEIINMIFDQFCVGK
jgi:tRNA modification GTPase